MQKTLIFLFFLLSYVPCSLAQDLIVTTKGDSINCRITKRQNDIVYFKYVKDNKVNATLIPSNRISFIQEGYYPQSEISSVAEYNVKKDFSRWRYGVNGGYSYRTGKIADNVSPSYKEYLKSLKSGFTIGGDIHYFVAETIGIGVIYGLNKHKAKMSGATENVTMHYVAASMLNRYILANPQKHVILGVNMGYQSYLDKAELNGDYLDISGGTLALGLEAGFEQELSPGALLYFGLGFKASTLTKVKVNQGPAIKLDKENFENLGRLELTLGLKFGK